MSIKTWTGSTYADIGTLGAGDKPAQAAWIWDGQWRQVWSAFTPMGAYLTSNIGGAGWKQHAPWQALPAYPDTIINGAQIMASLGPAKIFAQVGSSIYAGGQIRILVGGTVVAESATTTGVTRNISWQGNVTGPVTVESSLAFAFDQRTQGANSTFVTIDLPD